MYDASSAMRKAMTPAISDGRASRCKGTTVRMYSMCASLPPWKAITGSLSRASARPEVGHVGVDELGVEVACGCLDVGNDDRGVMGTQPLHGGPADARGRAGDDDAFRGGCHVVLLECLPAARTRDLERSRTGDDG